MTRNILAGLATFPVVISLTLGITIASGINPHFILLPIVITNILGTFFHPKSNAFYQIPVGLVVVFFVINTGSEISLDEPNLASMAMLMVPGLVFTLVSFLPYKFKLIPKSTIIAVSLGIGIFIILKQVFLIFGINQVGKPVALNPINILQFALCLVIPAFAFIGKRYLNQTQALAAAFFAISFLAFFLPIEYPLHKFEQFHLSQYIIQDWSISSLELKTALAQGFSITILMLCSFWGDFSPLAHYKISQDIEIKQSLRTVGIGNLLGSFFGLMPTNISLIESTTLAENKGNHRLASYILILLFAICAGVGFPNFPFPLFPISGVLIYIGIKLSIHAISLIKKEKAPVYLIGIAGALLLIFVDYLSGFSFALIAGIIHDILMAGKSKKEKLAQ
ncbi:MAG: SulP family inorganic anion transporter [Bacteroidota bacterium]